MYGTLISSVTVGAGGASSIDFTSIPQTGTDLMVIISHRPTTGSGLLMQFNGDSTTKYNERRIQGTGSAVSSVSYTSQTSFLCTSFQSTSATADTFSNNVVYISNYTSTSAKSISMDGVGENNATLAYQMLSAARYTGTSAITSISISATLIAQYSTASLYTITKGSGGATVS